MMSFRQAVAEVAFAPLLFWVYGFEKELQIEYVANSKVYALRLTPLPRVEFLSGFESSSSKGIPSYHLKLLGSGKVALLEFNSFEDRKGFQAFLESSFHQLQEKKIQNLIIDIRKNGGGDSNLGDDLLKYISPVPFTQYGKILVKISKEVKQQYNYAEVENTILENSLVADKLKKPHPDSARFGGNVYVLTSNFSFSSATDLAWYIKHYNIGKLVGEETGQWGVNFGELISFKLPTTKLSVRVAHKKFYCIGATDKSLHGVIPHYTVKII